MLTHPGHTRKGPDTPPRSTPPSRWTDRSDGFGPDARYLRTRSAARAHPVRVIRYLGGQSPRSQATTIFPSSPVDPTNTPLWVGAQPRLRPMIVPTAQALPRTFTRIVDQIAG